MNTNLILTVLSEDFTFQIELFFLIISFIGLLVLIKYSLSFNELPDPELAQVYRLNKQASPQNSLLYRGNNSLYMGIQSTYRDDLSQFHSINKKLKVGTSISLKKAA